MSNKLKIEDTCLTVEQAKELQALGVDFSEPIHHFYRNIETRNNGIKSICPWFIINEKVCQTCGMGSKSEFIPTLTNTEMLEIIPQNINICGRSFMFEIDHYSERYFVTYNCYVGEPDIIETYVSRDAVLLRDSLFEMLKYLKTNNLM